MKLLDLVVAQEALGRLLALEPPAAAAFQIARAAMPIQMELRSYERQRVALVQRLGEDDGQGQIKVSPEKSVKFNEEMNALLALEIKIEVGVLPPSVLTNDTCPECGAKIKSGIAIKSGDLMALHFLFEK